MYTYIYFDTRPEKNMQPIYVGKGAGNRHLAHLTDKCHNPILRSKIKKMKILGLEPTIQIIEATSELGAFELETALIKQYGRLDLKTGSLCNLTDGGEGHSGYVMTDEQKSKISKSNLGKTRSVEARAAISAGKTGTQFSDAGKELLRSKGHSVGQKNARAKTWTLEFQDKSVITVKSLKTWCKENSINYSSLFYRQNTQEFFNGVRILSSKLH